MPRSADKQLTHQPFKLGNYTVRPDLNEIVSGAGAARVKPKSMAVLLCLVEAAGNVCSRDHIFERVWGEAQLSDEVLTQAVAELRRALADDSRHPTAIQTIPRRGYRLVQAMHAPDPTDSVATPTPKVRGLLPYPGFNQHSTLIGRHPELSLLVQLLQQTGASQSALVLISGEPGIGKTRLAQEALKIAADDEQLALFGRCSEDQISGQYLPFAELIEQCIRIIPTTTLYNLLGETAPDLARVFPEFRRILDDLPPPTELPLEQQQRYFFNSFLAFLRKTAEMQPVCLLFDDLQWADEPTLKLLRHLATNLCEARVLMIGTFRESEIDQTKPFANFLEDVIAHRLTQRIALKPLNETSVGEMLESMTNQPVPPLWSKTVYERTEGNPFFVEELFQYLKEEGKALNRRGVWQVELSLDTIELPESLRWVLDQRLKRHDIATLKVLRAAAVMGRTFFIRPLLTLADNDESRLADIIRDVEQAWLVFPAAKQDDSSAVSLRYTFAHDLIRHALMSQISDVHRQQLHARIATEFETIYKNNLSEYAADIVYHLSHSGAADPGKLAHYYLLAARSALQKTAGVEALGFTNKALENISSIDKQTQAKLYSIHSQALRSLNRWEEAIAGWQQALAAFQTLGDEKGTAKCCLGMAAVFILSGRENEAYKITELGLQALGDTVHPLKVALLSEQAGAYAISDNLASAHDSLDSARAIAEQLNDPRLRGPLELSCGLVASAWVQIGDAQTHLETSVKTLRRDRNHWNLALAMAKVQFCLVTRGEWQKAEDINDELVGVIEQAGDAVAQVSNARDIALIQLARNGDVTEFEKAEQSSRNIVLRVAPKCLHMSAMVFAQTALWQNRLDEALEWCDEALQHEPFFWRGTSWALRAKILASRGDASALKGFKQYADRLPNSGQPMSCHVYKFVADLTEGLAMLGRLDKLSPHYEVLKQAIDATGAVFVPYHPQLLQKTLGILATGAGRWENAESHFKSALEQAERLPHVLEHAEVLRWYAWMLDQRGHPGDKSESSQLMRQARREYSNLGLDDFAGNVAHLAS
ncbi:MAG: AAA family ATPase [Pseudomonadales bacterium]